MLKLPPLALYIHLPWCERKCPYCDFNSYQAEAEPPFASYAERLQADLQEDCAWVEGRVLGSLFFGGGTPSLFPALVLARTLRGIAGAIDFAPDVEITLEANPGSAERSKFRALHSAGVNRLSLGVQSFCDSSLRALGRVHDAADARSAIVAAKAAGFSNINLDLMHGLPGQDISMAMQDLEQALAQEVPHLSWYQLTIEPNTAFHDRPPLLPVDDLLAEIQDRGEELLKRHGYQQYEVSAWALPGSQCRHNLNYWRFGDYIGIGAGAHGKLTLARTGEVLRTRKTRSPRDYLGARGDSARVIERVAREELALEFLMNALRLREGCSFEDFESRTGLAIEVIAGRLNALRDQGLMSSERGRIAATETGFRFLNVVLEHFS